MATRKNRVKRQDGILLLLLGLVVWLTSCTDSAPSEAIDGTDPFTASMLDTEKTDFENSEPFNSEAFISESSSSHRVVYERYEQPRSIVHLVQIPDPSLVDIQVVLADGLETVAQQAQDAGAIAALNAGFFDPQNQQTTSYVTIGGAIAADPRDNARLINNPDLAPYLEAILNRSEFRRLACGDRPQFTIAYHIAYHTDAPPSNCIIERAVGGGPRLLPSLQSVEEGFVAYGADGAVIRDAIGSLSPNARSAVGMTAAGEIVLVMVAQRPEVGDRTGMTLPELATFLESLGVRDALNLDGGSSSSLYVEGTTHYGRFDTEAQPVQRPIKSVIVVRPSRVP